MKRFFAACMVSVLFIGPVSARDTAIDGMQTIARDIACAFGDVTDSHVWIADTKKITALSKADGSREQIMLPDNQRVITGLRCVDDHVWVGTDQGLYIWDATLREWDGPAWPYRTIVDIAYDGRRMWVITREDIFSCGRDPAKYTSHTIHKADPLETFLRIDIFQDEVWVMGRKNVYNRYGSKGLFFVVESLAGLDDPRALSIAGSYAAIGTGSGDVVVFDKLTERTDPLSLPPSTGGRSFITTLRQDGRYLWVGTFEGIRIVDCLSDIVLELPADTLDQESIECIIIDDDAVFMGTPDRLVSMRRPYRRISLIPERTIIHDKTNAITCFVRGNDARIENDTTFEYRSATFPSLWHTAEVSGKNGTVSWKLHSIPSWNERYELRLRTGAGSDGAFLLESFVIIVDAVQPEVSFDPLTGHKQPGPVTITGRYNKKYIESIVIKPFNIDARVDHADRSFKAVVHLEPGVNVFSAQLQDRWGEHAETKMKVFVDDREAP